MSLPVTPWGAKNSANPGWVWERTGVSAWKTRQKGGLKSNGLSWPENYHIRLESGEFFILGHERVLLGYFSKNVYVVRAYSTIICNHFQKFQKFKDSKLFWWPFSLTLNSMSNSIVQKNLIAQERWAWKILIKINPHDTSNSSAMRVQTNRMTDFRQMHWQDWLHTLDCWSWGKFVHTQYESVNSLMSWVVVIPKEGRACVAVSRPAGTCLDPRGGPYLTYKAAKKSGYFCGP